MWCTGPSSKRLNREGPLRSSANKNINTDPPGATKESQEMRLKADTVTVELQESAGLWDRAPNYYNESESQARANFNWTAYLDCLAKIRGGHVTVDSSLRIGFEKAVLSSYAW